MSSPLSFTSSRALSFGVSRRVGVWRIDEAKLVYAVLPLPLGWVVETSRRQRPDLRVGGSGEDELRVASLRLSLFAALSSAATGGLMMRPVRPLTKCCMTSMRP